jgi:CBS domain-containing protein
MLVREAMRTNVIALPAHASLQELARSLRSDEHPRGQALYPVIDRQEHLVGVVMRSDLRRLLQSAHAGASSPTRPSSRHTLEDYVKRDPVVAYLDDTMRVAVNRMTETGFTRMPVVDRHAPDKLVGMVALHDLLKARLRNLEEERHRERMLHIHIFIPGRGRVVTRAVPAPGVESGVTPEAGAMPDAMPDAKPELDASSGGKSVLDSKSDGTSDMGARYEGKSAPAATPGAATEPEAQQETPPTGKS